MTGAADLIRIEGLRKTFPVRGMSRIRRSAGATTAVDGISLGIPEGRTLGLVGESGSGKTTTGRLILRLLEPTAGHVFFRGQDVFALPGAELRRMRRHMQIVFQDPHSSLNPRMTVRDSIRFSLYVNGLRTRGDEHEVLRLLGLVGLDRSFADRFPHQLSGGQLQRVGIARALAVKPEFVVLDEPVSALDVSIQAQILNLLVDLQAELGLTYLFISHDLAVVEQVSDHVAVMRSGRILESAPARVLFRRPLHPYTEYLVSSIPVPDPDIAANASGRHREQPHIADAELREIEPGHFAALPE